MAWIELHDDLPDHKKVIKLSGLLHLDKDAVVGKLIRLWLWALNNREDGVFQKCDVQTISEKMLYKGKAQGLIDAMLECRLLDECDGGYQIHKWDDRVCRLMDKREEKRRADALRKQNERARKRSMNSFAYDAWNAAFGAPANPAQIEELTAMAENYDEDTIRELIRSAAVAGAEQPVLYIRGMCRHLDTLGVKTYEDYAAYSDEIEMEKSRSTVVKILQNGT